MSNNQRSYAKVYETLRQYHPTERVNRIEMWVWVIVGLIQGQSVHLSVIATFIPSAAQAVARVAQVRRWLVICLPQAHRGGGAVAEGGSALGAARLAPV